MGLTIEIRVEGGGATIEALGWVVNPLEGKWEERRPHPPAPLSATERGVSGYFRGSHFPFPISRLWECRTIAIHKGGVLFNGNRRIRHHAHPTFQRERVQRTWATPRFHVVRRWSECGTWGEGSGIGKTTIHP
jgi:hypothetical protein